MKYTAGSPSQGCPATIRECQALPHDTPLIATIVAGLGLAFLFGLVAQRLRLPAIAGYLLAGVVIGPFTPGFVANADLASELAEIGVILLMFGVGLHFSLKDLLSVRTIAVPGAIGQIAVATLLGMGLAHLLGWSMGAGLVFGLTLSVASTVVLLRALQERRLVETERGRIAVGWLIVEDLVMVLTLVLIPPLAGLLGGKVELGQSSAGVQWLQAWGIDSVSGLLIVTAIKVSVFVALMLIVGRKVIPMLLHYVAHTGSRELFRLAVLAIALGIAFGSTHLFGVSFALGAFFAGMVLAESELSQQAARETLPLRDAFAVLFFVSVGMLLNPAVIVEQPLIILATCVIIVLGKSLAAYLIVRAFGHPNDVALTISASLAQIGEFSFILAVLGVQAQIMPPESRDLIVAGAMVSILLNPLLFMALDRMAKPAEPAETTPPPTSVPPPRAEAEPVLVVGFGRVGHRVVDGLTRAGRSVMVIDENDEKITALRASGVRGVTAAASTLSLLEHVDLTATRWLVSAIPDPFEAGSLIEQARAANPAIQIVARARNDAEVEYLRSLGADRIVVGEEEVALGMIHHILERPRF